MIINSKTYQETKAKLLNTRKKNAEEQAHLKGVLIREI